MQYTFLMCVHRDTGYFDSAVASVLQQTTADFELIIVANACTDELWQKISSLSDRRIRTIRTSIGQLAFNLNIGVNCARPGYILRIDADDICHPERLSKTIEVVRQNQAPDVIVGEARLIQPDGSVSGYRTVPSNHSDIVKALWRGNPIIHPAAAFKTSSITTAGGYCGGFMSEDYELWLRLARNPSIRFEPLHFPVTDYRLHTQQTKGQTLAYAEAASYLLREFLLSKGWAKASYCLGTGLAILKVWLYGKAATSRKP